MGFDREEFGEWEKRVVDLAEREGKRAVRTKWIVCAYLPSDMEKVMEGRKEGVTQKTKWRMPHAGSGKEEDVTYGWDEEEEKFKMAGTDTGGLTNASLRLGGEGLENAVFAKGGESANELYRAWKTLSWKKSFCCGGRPFREFRKWVRRGKEMGAEFLFWKKEGEEKIVMRADRVKEALGTYMLRTHSEGEYAKEGETEGMFAIVDTKYRTVVPNGNIANLKNEYDDSVSATLLAEKAWPSTIKSKKLEYRSCV